MGGKGNKRHIKRLASSRYMKISRKTSRYVAKPMPGRHTSKSSIALVTVLKEKIMDTSDSREAKYALKNGSIEVNGTVIREERYPVGFGDVIRIVPTSETFKVVSGKEGTFKMEKADGAQQIFKVIGKSMGRKGMISIMLHDGRIVNSGEKISVNDSVIIGKKGVEKVIKLEEGRSCYVVNGTHASETGKIKSITKGTMLRDPSVRIGGKDGEFETLLRNIMVTGE